MSRVALVVASSLLLLLAACDKPSGTAPSATAAPPSAAPRATVATAAGAAPSTSADAPSDPYALRCASCHGPRGEGDGPGAKFFPKKPRSFRDATWQKRVTDAELRRVILEGGPAVGLSTTMPAARDLASEPATVDALVRAVRDFGK